MPLPHAHVTTPSPAPNSSGARLVSVDGRELPLRGAKLHCDARGGLARVRLEQEFHNPHEEPLTVTYTLPLPADGAVSGYTFTIGDERVVGEVDRRSRAKERFEQALVEGHSAALLEEDRSSVFRQQVGNIPPGQSVRIETIVDQPCRWLAEGAWEWRFPTVVAPRYLGAQGRVSDADRVSVEVAQGESPRPRVELALLVRDALVAGAEPLSPSHALALREGGDGFEVGLREEEGAKLDRDVVVRWAVAAPRVGLTLDTTRPGPQRAHTDRAFGLLTVVPPAPEAEPESVSRDLIVLIDTSGSMHGEPLDQARRVVGAMVDTLGDDDQLELIEFSMRPSRWKRRAVKANAKNRRAAHKWLDALRAGGGTEMRSGIFEALRPIRRDSQRQVILITDGLIGFEEEIVATISNELPHGCRVHTIGVGSGVNRSLTGPAARAGRGTEAICGLGEDVEPVVQRMVAATTAPLVVDLELEGDALLARTERLPDLYAGAPALLSVAVDPAGGPITLRGRTASGEWSQTLEVPALEAGAGNPAVAALYGREAVEDLEMRRAAGDRDPSIDATIENIGLEFQIATRLTSWIAVSDNPTVDAADPSRRETMPQEVPYGMSVESFSMRRAAMPVAAAAVAQAFGAAPAGMAPPAPRAPQSKGFFTGGRVRRRAAPPAARQPTPDFEARDGGGGMDDADERERGIADDADELSQRLLGSVFEDRTVSLSVATELTGRVVLHSDGKLVIEIELAEDLEWERPSAVAVGAEDLAVDASKSTRSGPVKAGQTLRLSLELPDDAAVPTQLRFSTSTGDFVINLANG